MPNLQMNQFSLTPLKGRVALIPNVNTISVMVDPNSVNTLYPGDHVVLTTTAGDTILVDKAAAANISVGVVVVSPKKSAYVAKDAVEIVMSGSFVWGQASGSINRGDQLEFVPTGTLLKTNAGNPVCGIAFDAATDGSLFRYFVVTPESVPATITSGSINGVAIGGSTPAAGAFTTLSFTGALTSPAGQSVVQNVRTRVTLAQANAGITLLAAVTGRKYRLISYKVIAIGANAAATANATGVAIKATQSAAAVKLATTVLAGLTRSTVNGPTSASNTVLADGASFVQNDAATAITFGADGGSDLITATAFDVNIDYALES